MQNLLDYYQQCLARYTKEFDVVKRKLRLLSFSRLLAFIAAVLAIYFFRNNLTMAIVGSLLGIAVFLYLVHLYEDTKVHYRLVHALVKINATEIQVLQHDFAHLPTGAEYQDASHPYSHDLDLFGPGSFFQYLNRTHLREGKDALAQLLTSNSIEGINAKQETIDELALKPEWRQQFSAHAALVGEPLSVDEVTNWLQNYISFVPRVMRFLPWFFFAGFCLLAFFTYQWQWSLNPIILWMVLGLGITARFYKKLLQLSQKADQVKATFKQYSSLLKIIEETPFESPQLKFQKQRLLVAGKKASEAIGHFSRLLNTMDYNNNIFYAIFGNGCGLGALWTAYGVEEWIKGYGQFVGEWFQVVAFFEAHNSLGNFAFNHPLYSYPILSDVPNMLRCEELGHPLIPKKKNVRNNIEILEKDFFIITGSNMAGKSTFLRSTGLCLVMANMGLPVFAKECLYHPRKLVTSMRSVDSLYKGDSYFLSELKRLKKVIQLLETEPYFVLLDEILKGTNSRDKAIGSKKFLARLIRAKTTGLIATHDLSLCETAKEYPNVHNYHLDATIENGELYFDYRLKEGVSQTMNASFLLKKMDLV